MDINLGLSPIYASGGSKMKRFQIERSVSIFLAIQIAYNKAL